MKSGLDFKINGPHFKDEEHYLTLEGYPLGTTCYYYSLEMCGDRYLVCGDTEIKALIETMKKITEIWDSVKHEFNIKEEQQ